MFCTNCGSSNEPGVKFCTNCGNKLDFQEAYTVVPEQEDVVVTDKVSGNESIYNEAVNNMQEVYKNNDYSYDEYVPKVPRYTLGLLSLIFAGVGVLFCCCCCCNGYITTAFEILFCIASIVLGIISLVTHEDKKALAIVGMSVSCIFIVCTCSNITINTIARKTTNYNWYNTINNSSTNPPITTTYDYDDIMQMIEDLSDSIDF